ncbi:MAG: NTP transferase domain-containing protein [Planctomycetes bacterium]|nr:NTP transferase domain-containing protein [Planctomycetota bacterium]
MAVPVTAVILAAGKGQRLRPLSDAVPKMLAPVAGQPIIARVMEQIAAAGVADFVVVAHEGDRRLAQALRQTPFPVALALQRERLGMAHALLQARDAAKGRHLLVASCDNLHTVGHMQAFLRLHLDGGCDATLTAWRLPPEEMGRSSTLGLDGDRVTAIIEKPRPEQMISNVASVPPFLFRREILEACARVPLSGRGEYELQTAVAAWIGEGRVVRALFTPARMHLTTIDDLLAINAHYLDALPPDRLASGPGIRGPVLILEGATVGQGCRLGPHVVVGRRAVVGAGCEISRSVVLDGARVPPGTVAAGSAFFQTGE